MRPEGLFKHLLNMYTLCSKQILNLLLQAVSSPILGKAARRSPVRLHSTAGKETSLEMSTGEKPSPDTGSWESWGQVYWGAARGLARTCSKK